MAVCGAAAEVLAMMDLGQEMDSVNNASRATEGSRVEGSARILGSLLAPELVRIESIDNNMFSNRICRPDQIADKHSYT